MSNIQASPEPSPYELENVAYQIDQCGIFKGSASESKRIRNEGHFGMHQQSCCSLSDNGKLQIMAVLDSFSILKCACVTISRQTVRQFRLKKDTRRVRPRDIDSPSPH